MVRLNPVEKRALLPAIVLGVTLTVGGIIGYHLYKTPNQRRWSARVAEAFGGSTAGLLMFRLPVSVIEHSAISVSC
jgi:zinc transporter ZupT